MKRTLTVIALIAISLSGCTKKEKPGTSPTEEKIEETVESVEVEKVVKEEKVDPNAPFFKFDTPYSFCSEILDDNLITNNYVDFTIQKNGKVKGTVSNTAAMKGQENAFNRFSGEFEGKITYFYEGIKIVGYLELSSSDSPEVIKEKQIYYLLKDFTFIELLIQKQLIIRYKSCE